MSAVKSTTVISELVKRGFTPEQALALESGSMPKASGPAVAAAQPKAEVPAFIVQFAQNRQARRALAADLRARGIEPKGAAWAKAKKAAGIA